MRKILAALAASGLAAGMAGGGIVEWDGGAGNSNWHAPANWDTNSVPGPGDRVIIYDATVVIEDQDVTIDSFHLIKGTSLTVRGVTLTLENDKHLAHQCQNGVNCSDDSYFEIDIQSPSMEMEENAAGQVGSIEIVKNDHAFWGYGEVTDNHIGASLTIASGLVFTNSLRDDVGSSRVPAIRGAWTISGGTFLNDGRVEAIGRAGIDPPFEITSIISDTSAATWATGCGQRLRFLYNSPLALSGDFEDVPAIDFRGGTLEFVNTVTTCGLYRREGCGGIDVDEEDGKTFEYAAFENIGPPTCDNPGDVVGTPTCSNRYVVDDDVAEDAGPCGES